MASVKSCDMLYANGNKYVWGVVTEDWGDSPFPINSDLIADGSIWEDILTEADDEAADSDNDSAST